MYDLYTSIWVYIFFGIWCMHFIFRKMLKLHSFLITSLYVKLSILENNIVSLYI